MCLNLAKYKEDSSTVLILEVKLEWQKTMHDTHNSYPLAPEQLPVSDDILSNYNKQIQSKFNMSSGLVQKLIPNQIDKSKYVLHYRNLQLYLSLGFKVKKVHRVLQFNQLLCLKQNINFNTKKHNDGKNAFEKHFSKLINNSAFGKRCRTLSRESTFD